MHAHAGVRSAVAGRCAHCSLQVHGLLLRHVHALRVTHHAHAVLLSVGWHPCAGVVLLHGSRVMMMWRRHHAARTLAHVTAAGHHRPVPAGQARLTDVQTFRSNVYIRRALAAHYGTGVSGSLRCWLNVSHAAAAAAATDAAGVRSLWGTGLCSHIRVVRLRYSAG